MRKLERLPDHSIEFDFSNGRYARVAAHTVNGRLFHTRVDLSGFTEDYSSVENLKSAILKVVDVLAAAQFQILP